jgi:hypothetical protein
MLARNTIITLIAFAALGISSAAIARGGGGGGGGHGGSGGHGSFGGQFGHHFGHFNRFDHRFLRNQVLLDGWGWGWGWPYSDGGYSNTTLITYPQAVPQAASGVDATPCRWNDETFTVPSSAGGTRPVQVVTCR